jgi:hypothetical protein
LGKVELEEKKLVLNSPEKAKEGDVFNENNHNETGGTAPSDETPLPIHPEVKAERTDNPFEGAPEIDHGDPDLLPLPDHNNKQSPSTSPRLSIDP